MLIPTDPDQLAMHRARCIQRLLLQQQQQMRDRQRQCLEVAALVGQGIARGAGLGLN